MDSDDQALHHYFDAEFSNRRVLVLLDERRDLLAPLQAFLEDLGHEVQYAEIRGDEDISEELPLIIISCPGVDPVAARQILQQNKLMASSIPVLFLSDDSLATEATMPPLAGDEQLIAWPTERALLASRLTFTRKINELSQSLKASQAELEQFHQAIQNEQMLASHVLERFNKPSGATQSHVQTWLKSAVNLSGDVTCIARSPDGEDIVMLADSTGHGLVAAICTLPAIDIFHSLARLGADISEIACAINQKLYETLPTGHFVAATIVSLNKQTRTLSVWNGGMPFCHFFSDTGQNDYRFNSRHPPLGTISPQQFLATQERYELAADQGGTLLICSDGVTEARNRQGRQFSETGVLSSMAQINHEDGRVLIRQLAEALDEHVEGGKLNDDASLVCIRYNPE